MMKLASLLRVMPVLAAVCTIFASTAAHAICPDDCGGVVFKLNWFFNDGAEVRVGYDSMAFAPITYHDGRLGTASIGYAAEFVQPIHLRDLSAGDVVALLREARLEASINEALTSPDMHNSRFQLTGTQFVGINLYDAFHGTADPLYGAKFSFDFQTKVGTLDVGFPLIGIAYEGTDAHSRIYGLAPSLHLLGESTPGLCGEAAGHSCFTFSRGEYAFRTLAIPEPDAWVLMIAGFVATGAALRRRASAIA